MDGFLSFFDPHSGAPMGNLLKVKGTAMGPLQGDLAWSGDAQTA